MSGPIGGPGPMWKRAIWLFISCCIALAVYNGVIGGNPATAYERLQHKSEEVRDKAENLGRKIDHGITKTTTNGSGSKPNKNQKSGKPNNTK